MVKKVIKIVCMSVLLCLSISMLSGCGIDSKSFNEEVENLVSKLSRESEMCAKEYFDKTINMNEFNLEIVEEVKTNHFTTLKDVTTTNPIYLMGYRSGKPKDIISFIVKYEDGIVTSYALETMDMERTYVDVERSVN